MPAGWALLGLVAGALLDRLTRAMAATRVDLGDDFCPVCDTFRFDRRLVPLLGPILAGPCPKCGRHPWQESVAIVVATALAFAALAWRLPAGWALAVFSAYTAVLAITFITDMRHRLILNVVTYPSMLVALVAGATLFGPNLAAGLGRTLLGGLFGGGLFLFLYVLSVLLYRRADALGLGDVKLALLIGLMTGWPGAMAAILLGAILGAIMGVVVMMRARSGKETMPYGIALSVGALLSILWQPPV